MEYKKFMKLSDLSREIELSKLRHDKEKLDFIESRDVNKLGWVVRESTTGRGFRIHTAHHRDILPEVKGQTLREAIADAIKKDG